MRKKTLIKENEGLSKANQYLHDRIGGLEKQLSISDNVISKYYKDLDAEKKKYAALLEKYIAMMETKVNSHRVYEKKIKDVKIIVKEQEKRPVYTYDMSGVEVKETSTVGVKFQYGGFEYGDYIVYNKPTLEVCDVVEAANVLFVSLLNALDQPQEGDENGKQI